MLLNDTKCCGIQEIHLLSDHASAEEAMNAFCNLAIGQPIKFRGDRGTTGTIFSFYLFTAAVPHPDQPNGYTFKPYGDNFKKFIEENKLGEVWESPAKVNHAFHAQHANKVWIWMPINTRLREWWTEKNKNKVSSNPKEIKK